MAGPGGYLVFGDSVNFNGNILIEEVLEEIDNPRLDSFEGWDEPYFEYVSSYGGSQKYVSGASVSMPYTYKQGTVRMGASNGYAIIGHYASEALAQREADAFNDARQPGDLTLAGVAYQQYGQYAGQWRCYYMTYNASTVEWQSGERIGYITGTMPILEIRSIRMDPSLIMIMGEMGQIIPIVDTYPQYVKVDITWESSNPWVVSVDGGHYVAHRVGYSRITASVSGLTAECEVTVIESAQGGVVYVRDGNQWKKAKVYVRDGGAWREAQARVRDGNQWKKTKEV